MENSGGGAGQQPSAGEKSVFDPSYTLADFRQQLLGGGLLWLSLVLAVVAVAATVLSLTVPWLRDTGMYFPFRASGKAIPAITGLASLIWSALAVANWRNRRAQR